MMLVVLSAPPVSEFLDLGFRIDGTRESGPGTLVLGADSGQFLVMGSADWNGYGGTDCGADTTDACENSITGYPSFVFDILDSDFRPITEHPSEDDPCCEATGSVGMDDGEIEFVDEGVSGDWHYYEITFDPNMHGTCFDVPSNGCPGLTTESTSYVEALNTIKYEVYSTGSYTGPIEIQAQVTHGGMSTLSDFCETSDAEYSISLQVGYCYPDET